MAVYKFGNDNYEGSSINKKIGIAMLVLCSLSFLALLTNLLMFLKLFLLGMFGLFAYPLFIVLFIVGLALINNKKYVMTTRYVVYCLCAIISFLAIIQLMLVDSTGLSFFQYLGKCYTKQITSGGIIVGIFLAPVLYILNSTAAYIIFGILLLIFSALIADYLYYGKNQVKMKKPVVISDIQKTTALKKTAVGTKENINITLGGYQQNESMEEVNKRKLGIPSESELKPPTDRKKLKEYLLTPTNTTINDIIRPDKKEIDSKINLVKNETEQVQKPAKFFHDDVVNEPATPIQEDIDVEEEKNKESISKKIFIDLLGDEDKEIKINTQPISIDTEKKQFRQKEINQQKHIDYVKPPLELITTPSVDLSTLNEDVVEKRALLENALETFGIPAHVVGVVVGPAVTRYELEMPPGISVKKVNAHAEDIAYALASNGNIRIEAPVPGRSVVGVEVPNENIATVSLHEVLSAPDFQNHKGKLIVGLGKDIGGQIRLCNLEKMPHLLVAGSTNSGKSVCLNSIILSLIYRNSPDDVKLILIDPKRVEFAPYNGIPHLLVKEAITETDKALNALNYAIDEMERRFELLKQTTTKDINEYNSCREVTSGEKEKLFRIVIIIDELNELMVASKKEVELKLMRLAQKARATGIHLIAATQRPSVDVITGTIKSNFPSRITFSLNSFADSRTVIDQGGAEKLLGRGDMLYAPSDASEPMRIQGCYLSTPEIKNIVNYVIDNNPDYQFDSDVENYIYPPKSTEVEEENNNYMASQQRTGIDPLLPEVLKYFIEAGQASITMIQRRYTVGFARASRIIDQMEREKYISMPEGNNKGRTVLISMSEYEEIFGKG